MVLVESVIDSDQVLLMSPIWIENCDLVLKQVVLAESAVFILYSWFGCSRGIGFLPEFLYSQRKKSPGLLLSIVIFFWSFRIKDSNTFSIEN